MFSQALEVDIAATDQIPCVKCQANKEASTRLALAVPENGRKFRAEQCLELRVRK